MPQTTEEYKNHQIKVQTVTDEKAQLKIDEKVVSYALLKNGKFYTDYIPYQDFESLMEMAKYIIDYLPNVVFEETDQ